MTCTHCKAKFLLMMIADYYCIAIMDLCDMVIALLHISNVEVDLNLDLDLLWVDHYS